MKRRNGFGSRERGKTSIVILKKRYENPRAYSLYLAGKLVKKNIPKSLEGFDEILKRVAEEMTRENQLGLSCKAIAKLIEFEIGNKGYKIEDINGYRTIRVWRNFTSSKKNLFEVKECEITCPDQEAEIIKRTIKERLRRLYGLNIKFGSPPKR